MRALDDKVDLIILNQKENKAFFKNYTGMNDPPYQMFTPKGEQITLILIKYNHLKFHHQILTRSLYG